jgi:ABC-type polysaccharide/polyol phosphate transport system ATPase subunit
VNAVGAVSVRNVSKRFRFPHQQYNTLKERALHPFAARQFDELQAVRSATFDVAPGEFFGIVGRNGSGKSTLLKCLAGIYATDSGSISVNGRLSPFIELGVGFNPEMTARDNVVINAIMLGLTRRQARERFDEIIAFAELEEFVDLKLKNYSSGMSVRLGFAVAVEVDADVLLVDEVLAVGDAAFQQKCFDQFDRLKAEGRTIIFVTHDMGSVRRFCDRAMLIERGEIVEIGDPQLVAQKYGEINFGSVDEDSTVGADGLPRVKILDTWCDSDGGKNVGVLRQEETCMACMTVEFKDPVVDPLFSITFRNDVRHTIMVARSDRNGPTGPFGAGQRVTARFTFPTWLAPSAYTLTSAVFTSDGRIPLDQRVDAAHVIVESGQYSGGVVDLPTSVEIEDVDD